MQQFIEQRIAQLKKKHSSIESEMKLAQQFLQEKVAEINGVKGALMELEGLIKSLTEPIHSEPEVKD
jgi:chromosome segregation ATPase